MFKHKIKHICQLELVMYVERNILVYIIVFLYLPNNL